MDVINYFTLIYYGYIIMQFIVSVGCPGCVMVRVRKQLFEFEKDTLPSLKKRDHRTTTNNSLYDFFL